MQHGRTRISGRGNRPYLITWAVLLFLTGVTLLVTKMDMGKVSVLGSLLIASTKAGLVLFFFMHLSHETPLLKAMLSIVLLLLTAIIGFTFLDILYR